MISPIQTLGQGLHKHSSMPKQDNTPQITDEMVKKFISYVSKNLPTESTALDLWERVKLESSVSNSGKDWEIVRMKSEVPPKYPTVYFDLQPSGKFVSDEWPNEEFDLKDDLLENKIGKKYSIHSVRRLSDGEVFTIGDEVKTNGEEIKNWWGKITEFWITGGNDMHIVYNGHHYDISTFEKKAHIPEEKTPIGIIPEWLWKEQRIKELKAAIDRYMEHNDKMVPIEWFAELYALESWHKGWEQDIEKKSKGGK